MIIFFLLMLLPQTAPLDDPCPQSELFLDGDYLLGGLVELYENYNASDTLGSWKPGEMLCNRWSFSESNYHMIQVMRFTIESINNSSDLLPGVKLGYRILDFCDSRLSFSAALDLLAQSGGEGQRSVVEAVPVWDGSDYSPKVISVIGPFGSTQTINVAPFFMAQLIPMVNPSSSSVRLSQKARFPSFFRTIPSDIHQIKVIVQLLQTFKWNWVAFLGGDDDYSYDAFEQFLGEIRELSICLAYSKTISSASIPSILRNLSSLNIKVVIIFANSNSADSFLEQAMEKGITDTVWIASEAWSLNRNLLEKLGKVKLGTVIGITLQKRKNLKGLDNFILSSQAESVCDPQEKELACNQLCPECSSTERKKVVEQDQTYDICVYAAVHAVAHALHDVLNCNEAHCFTNNPVKPHMITAALKQVKVQLDNETIEFDQCGDPPALYSIVYWNWTCTIPDFMIIGSYSANQKPAFNINATSIIWFDGTNTAPVLQCSSNCPPGNRRVPANSKTCCYHCQSCPSGTYINSTVNPYTCVTCQENEWAERNSTSCSQRSMHFLDVSKPLTIVLILLAGFVLLISMAITVMFLRHGDTPVVRSAGGWLCVFMLGCLSLSSVSVLLHLGPPSPVCCSLRYPIFIVCFGAVLSCLAVRSFQIVCIFKMAAKLPRAHTAWVRYGGQWVTVTTCTCTLLLLCIVWLTVGGPQPTKTPLHTAMVLDCNFGNISVFISLCLVLVILVTACFFFAYMGIDLPKNYNEGRSIIFSLLLLILALTALLTVYSMKLQEHYLVVNTLFILISLYAVLVGYFLPKCYIILLAPERNTHAYFQRAIQNYTLQTRL